jgi:aryl-alcohol dehydrogenase-like predicted oxidoreductase
VRGKALPDWARGFADSWGRFFLKFILAHPAVTCVIPGTDDPKHMADNLGAGRGPLPDAEERRRMIAWWEGL